MFRRNYLLTIVQLASLLLFIRPSTGTTTGATTVTSSSSIGSSDFSSVSIYNDTNSTDFTTGTTTVSTTTTTAVPTTTAAPVSDVPYQKDVAVFVLTLTVGTDNTSEIRGPMTNQSTHLTKFKNVFQNIAFIVDLTVTNMQVPQIFLLKLEFLQRNYDNGSEKLEDAINKALKDLTSSGEYSFPNQSLIDDKIAHFANQTGDICNAKNICPLGFQCNILGCGHICRNRDCSGQGTCYVSVHSNLTVTTLCQCNSGYSMEYTGDNCEYSRRGRLQIIAIIAGVLGAACLVFIVVIIFMCIRQRRHSSSSNYNISGASYGNSAFEGQHAK